MCDIGYQFKLCYVFKQGLRGMIGQRDCGSIADFVWIVIGEVEMLTGNWIQFQCFSVFKSGNYTLATVTYDYSHMRISE